MLFNKFNQKNIDLIKIAKQSKIIINNSNLILNSDIVHRLGYVVFIHGSGVRLPVSE